MLKQSTSIPGTFHSRILPRPSNQTLPVSRTCYIREHAPIPPHPNILLIFMTDEHRIVIYLQSSHLQSLHEHRLGLISVIHKQMRSRLDQNQYVLLSGHQHKTLQITPFLVTEVFVPSLIRITFFRQQMQSTGLREMRYIIPDQF